MNAFEAYRTYLAVKQHFNSDFDFFRYYGKVSVKVSSFEKRNDKYFFEKLSKLQNPIDYLVANFIQNNKVYIKNLFSDECKKIYNEWAKQQQSLSYFLKQDLTKLESDFDSNFFCASNSHPVLLKKYISKEISFDTLCVLLDVTDAMKYWKKKLQNDPLFQEYSFKIEKYTPFIKYDKDKIRKLIIDYYSNNS